MNGRRRAVIVFWGILFLFVISARVGAITLWDAIDTALVHSLRIRQVNIDLERAELNYRNILANNDFRSGVRFEGEESFDEDRNVTLFVDVPGFQTETTRLNRFRGQVFLTRTFLNDLNLDLGAGWRFTDFNSSRSGSAKTRNKLLTAELTYPILPRGEQKYQRRLAELDLEISKIDREISIKEIIVEVNRAFFEAVSSDKTFLMDKDQVEYLEEVYRTAMARYRNGEELEIEVEEAKLTLQESRLELELSRSDKEDAYHKLADLIGLEEIERLDDVSIEGILDDVWKDNDLKLESHPELKQMRLNIQRTREQLERERREVLPEVELKGGFDWEDQNQSIGRTRTAKDYSINIEARWEFFDAGTSQRDIRRAELALQRNNLEWEDKKRELKNELGGLLREWEQTKELYSVALRQKEIARKRYELEETKYESGEALLADVRRAYINYKNSLSTVLSRKREIVEKWLDYHYFKGDLIRTLHDRY